MDSLKNRNSPFSPFSVNSVTEIHRPPFRRGVSSVFSVKTLKCHLLVRRVD